MTIYYILNINQNVKEGLYYILYASLNYQIHISDSIYVLLEAFRYMDIIDGCNIWNRMEARNNMEAGYSIRRGNVHFNNVYVCYSIYVYKSKEVNVTFQDTYLRDCFIRYGCYYCLDY